MKKPIFIGLLLIGLVVASSAFAIDRADCPVHPGLTLLKTHINYCQFEGALTQPDPITHQPRKIPFFYYFSRVTAATNAPVVLVYPALSGTIPWIENLFSEMLVRRGYHAIVVQLVEDISDLNRLPSQINDFFIRSNWSSSALMDLSQTWPEIDANQFNAAGVSLGGIRAAVAFGDDLRLKHLIGYVTGGNLPDIFAHTGVKLLTRYREHWKAKLGLASDEDFATYLRSVLMIDPLQTAKKRPIGDNVYLILGESDKMVPYVDEVELLEAYGNPPHRTTPFGHRLTGASFLTNFSEVIRTLETQVR